MQVTVSRAAAASVPDAADAALVAPWGTRVARAAPDRQIPPIEARAARAKFARAGRLRRFGSGSAFEREADRN
jgi:hypothetical protein